MARASDFYAAAKGLVTRQRHRVYKAGLYSFAAINALCAFTNFTLGSIEFKLAANGQTQAGWRMPFTSPENGSLGGILVLNPKAPSVETGADDINRPPGPFGDYLQAGAMVHAAGALGCFLAARAVRTRRNDPQP